MYTQHKTFTAEANDTSKIRQINVDANKDGVSIEFMPEKKHDVRIDGFGTENVLSLFQKLIKEGELSNAFATQVCFEFPNYYVNIIDLNDKEHVAHLASLYSTMLNNIRTLNRYEDFSGMEEFATMSDHELIGYHLNSFLQNVDRINTRSRAINFIINEIMKEGFDYNKTSSDFKDKCNQILSVNEHVFHFADELIKRQLFKGYRNGTKDSNIARLYLNDASITEYEIYTDQLVNEEILYLQPALSKNRIISTIHLKHVSTDRFYKLLDSYEKLKKDISKKIEISIKVEDLKDEQIASLVRIMQMDLPIYSFTCIRPAATLNVQSQLTLFESLSFLTKMTYLRLSHFNINGDLSDHLCYGLKNMKNLEQLDLENNGIASDIVNIIQSMTELAKISRLTLMSNPIGDIGAEALANAMNQMTCLTHLDLDDCKISNAGAKALAKSLLSNNSVRAIHLQGNTITDEALILFSYVLRANPILNILNVAQIRSTTANTEYAVFVLCQALAYNNTFRNVSATSTPMTEKLSAATLCILNQNKNISVLDIDTENVAETVDQANARWNPILNALNAHPSITCFANVNSIYATCNTITQHNTKFSHLLHNSLEALLQAKDTDQTLANDNFKKNYEHALNFGYPADAPIRIEASQEQLMSLPKEILSAVTKLSCIRWKGDKIHHESIITIKSSDYLSQIGSKTDVSKIINRETPSRNFSFT